MPTLAGCFNWGTMNFKYKWALWAIITLVGFAVIGLAWHFFGPVKATKPDIISQQPHSRTGIPGKTAAAVPTSTTMVQPVGQAHPFRVAPPNTYTMADAGSLDFLKHAQRLTYRDDRPNANGEYRRVSLYQTDLKYPLVRVEETLIKQPNGQDVVLSEDATSADHVVVRAQAGETAADVARLAAQNGETVLKSMHTPDYYLIQLSNVNIDSVPIAIQTLSQKSGVVRYAEPDEIVHSSLTPNDPSFSNEWGMNNTGQTGGTAHADISAPSAWGIINSSPNVVVAVIDTGIDFNHPDLSANIWTNPHPGSLSGYSNDLHGWNFYANTNSPQDDNFHGTHVSGTIGAVGNNGVGVAGVTWHVQIMPLKFLSSSGSGYTSDAVDAITYATAMGAKIMSNSWGGGAYSQSLKDAIDAANNAGILFVAAAGNNGANNDTVPFYPACYASSNIISVAATDANDNLASFSDYGQSSVQIAAPGVGIYSTLPTTQTAAMTSEGLTTSYGTLSGTSMATPVVSGASALALAQTPTLTVAQLKSLITSRSDTLAQLYGLDSSSGRLDLYNMVNPNWKGNGPILQLSSTTFDDNYGNNDGTPNPGEIIDLTPNIYNSGGSVANGVTVTLTAQQSTATVLTGPINLGSIAAKQTVTPLSPCQVQLSSSLTAGTVLKFTVTIQSANASTVQGTATVTVQASRGYAERSVSYQVGEIKADPSRNVVYVGDVTNKRILAIDTGLGQLVALSNLTSAPGQMAVSQDDSKLYVSLPNASQIAVFTLPSLSPLGILSVNFSPFSIACGPSGRLYVADSSSDWANIQQINSTNGQIVERFSGNFYAPLLRTSTDGTKLYEADTESSGLTEEANQFDISTATTTLRKQFSVPGSNLEDFAVDDANSRLFVMDGGVYAVCVVSMINDAQTTWPELGAYGVAVSLTATGTVVWGGSGDAYSGGIVKYDRSSGTQLKTYPLGVNGLGIKTRGLAATPNGNCLYVRSSTGYGASADIGIIGGNSIDLTNPPPLATGPDLNLANVTFSDVEGNGDGAANPGEIIDLTPIISNFGGQMAANVGVSVAGDSNVTVLTASQNIPSIAVNSTAGTPAPLRVQVGASVMVGTVVNLTFTITPPSGPVQTYPYFFLVQPLLKLNTVASSIQVGETLADQQRDVVYIMDKTDMEVLAFDTDAGHITATVPTTGGPPSSWVNQLSGMMAESVDGTALYLAEPQSNSIEEFALPGLTSVAHWTYSFSPMSLATDAQGRLYCTTTDSTQKLVQINGTTGAILSQSGPAFVSPTSVYSTPSILHRNAAGTELYGSLVSPATIFRFSTTGTGAPTQIASISLTGSPYDFTVDETHSTFDLVLFDGTVTTIPLAGGTPQKWPMAISSSYGLNSVSLLPGNTGLIAGYNYTPGYLCYFSTGNGSDLHDYALNDSYTIKQRGLATTPNGRTLYVESYSVGTSSSIDGFAYKVGLIGGTVDLQPPGPTPIALQSVTITDPAPGSNDGFIHPGQTIQLAPVFKNFLNFQITGVSVQITTTDSYVTLNTPTTESIGNVASYATFSPATNFSATISSSAPDSHAIPINFVVTYNGSITQTIPYTVYVTSLGQPPQQQVNFAIGDLLSDPTRDLCYVVDNTDQRLLAIDTDAAAISKSVRLAASPGIGHLALSADGTHLYIAETVAQQIQVISLPSMQQCDIIPLNFQPYSLAAGSDGMLYVTSADNAWEYLRQVNPATGEIVGQFGKQTYYQQSILRTSGDHTSLYAAETGLSGFGSIDHYGVVTSALPAYLNSYPFTLSNLFDLAVDDTYNRAYSVSGGIYGVGVTNLTTGVTTTWPDNSSYAPYGDAVSFLPSGTFIYGGAYGGIRRYNRADGTPLGDYTFTTANAELMPRGMAITANGRVLFATSEFTGNSSLGIAGYYYRLGLIGASSLTIANPTPAPAINAGSDQAVHLSNGASVSASTIGSTNNLPVSWTMVSGPAKISVVPGSTAGTASVGFSAPGTYQISSTATDGGLQGSDVINVTVLPDSSAVSVEATAPSAVSEFSNGQLTFSRTGSTSGALAVNYTVTGNAQSGVDYSALPGTVTIPDGASSASVPVVALDPTTNNSEVVVTIGTSSNYSIGVSQQAIVTLFQPTFSLWVSNKLAAFPTGQQTASANPAHDGISNLLKYALNMDPTVNSTQGMPVTALSAPISGQQYLTLSFTQREDITDISYVVEVSSDLVSWSSGPTATVTVSSTFLGNGMFTTVVRDLTPITPSNRSRFIRLKVSQQ